jgi:hypothetical protein
LEPFEIGFIMLCDRLTPALSPAGTQLASDHVYGVHAEGHIERRQRMTALTIRVFDTPDAAYAACERLFEMGVPRGSAYVVDATGVRQGTFADAEPQMHNRAVERKGSFADTEPEHRDRNLEPHGSFADTDSQGGRMPTYPKGDFAKGMRETPLPSEGDLRDLLDRLGVAEADREECVTHLRNGRALLMIEDMTPVR